MPDQIPNGIRDLEGARLHPEGPAATSQILGAPNVAVYDNSTQESTRDRSPPNEPIA